MKHLIGKSVPAPRSLRFGRFGRLCRFCRLVRAAVIPVFAALLCAGAAGCADSDDYEIYATLCGTVSDYSTGQPVENAVVVLAPSNRTATTAADGRFLFENLDAQQYTLTVQKTGYQPDRKTVAAVSGERVEVNIPIRKINP